MEKEPQPDSMATITMKPEYPPSEVYSASEPPPAYRHRLSNSVQIARIAALTIIVASFIVGSFILASSWISARSSCYQLEQLDAMLDKNLALEGRSYGNDGLMPDEPLPIGNAHALHAAPPAPESTASPSPQPALFSSSLSKEEPLNHAETKIDEDKLQKLDDDKTESVNSGSDESSDSDSSGEEDDDDLIRPMFKLPIQFDLDELAGAFLANNQKGRMNCVVERQREDPMERKFPFNLLGAFAPRSSQAERIAIICHGGDERQMPVFPDPQSQVFAFPLSGPMHLPMRPQPERPMNQGPESRGPFQGPQPRGPFQGPESRGPFQGLESRGPFQGPESRGPFQGPESRGPFQGPESRGPFQGQPQHRPAPFPLPLPWDSSEEQMAPPREMRIHVQRVFAIPAPHNMPQGPEGMMQFAPPPLPQQPDQNEQRLADSEDMPPRQMRVIAFPPLPQEAMGPFAPPPPPAHSQDQNEEPTILHQFVPQPAPTQELEQPEVQKMETEGRKVQMNLPWDLTPEDLHMIHRTAQDVVAHQNREQQMSDNDMQEVKTIVNTLTAAAEAEEADQRRAESNEQQQRAQRTILLPQELPAEERPHYMQPRSVRSVDALVNNNEKRVKRCACDCI